MKTTFFSALFALVTSATALSVQIERRENGTLTKRDTYANFFDDTECTVNGGIGVDMTNDGCLQEFGRQSVYIPNTGTLDQWCLVKTRDSSECNCQNEGYDFTSTGFCALLDPSFHSYRFINQPCAQNNC